MNLEQFFSPFRKQIIGIDQTFQTPYGLKKMRYTDWTASGRLYAPIENKITHQFGPFVANTHTETSTSGAAMTLAYREARKIIKNHVNATDNDVLITSGSGMTGVVNKLQRILGLKVSEGLKVHTTFQKTQTDCLCFSYGTPFQSDFLARNNCRCRSCSL